MITNLKEQIYNLESLLSELKKEYEEESVENYIQSIKRSSSYYVLKLELLYI